MKINLYLLTGVAFALLWFSSCQKEASMQTEVSSPDQKVRVGFSLTEAGQPAYAVFYKDSMLIDTSLLGFDLKDQPDIREGWEIKETNSREVRESWNPVWGEASVFENRFNELTISLQESRIPKRQMHLVFRVYDDGLGFRYEFPEQSEMDEVVILNENTQFKLRGDHTTWWIPGDWDIYEHLYNTTLFSGIDATSKRNHPNLAQTFIPNNAVNTPVTMRTSDGIYLSFHEANLTDYAGMTLLVDKENMQWISGLVGRAMDSVKVETQVPFHTPWRSLQISETASGLIDSRLIVNLNEPNKLEDTGWIKPVKYMGIWWEMHMGKSTWAMEGGQHGATTENAKRYIDFASANDIPALLIEGWNTGWEDWVGEDREGIFDFITPYPDFDIEEVVRYGKEKGVEIIGHHETSAAVSTYERQLDTAFQFYKDLGINKIKTGYVGTIIPQGYYHHGQYMVRHYRQVLEKAAEYKIMLNVHEPIKATGLRRTYPNMMTREGLRGQEFNAWSSDLNPPEHTVIVPFTRMLAGPIDFTPGIFDLKFNAWKEENQVNTTLAKQLALYVTLYSPMQMAADLPENYAGNPAFQFIRDVGVDWEKSIVLNAEVGDYLTMVRKQKGTDRWFLGSTTDENPRQFVITLDFLDEGKTYRASIYADAAEAHWDENPTAIQIRNQNVSKGDTLKLDLAPGGGAAVSFFPE